jgi:hypothetical protein
LDERGAGNELHGSVLQREVEKFAMRFREKVEAIARWIFEENE